MTADEFKVKKIEQFLGVKYEGSTEEEMQVFIQQYDEQANQETAKLLKKLSQIAMADVYLFRSHEMKTEDYIVANTRKEALELFIGILEELNMIAPEDLEIVLMDKYNDQLSVAEELVPEYDRHLWENEVWEDGERYYKVDLIYCVDYFLFATGQSIPAILI